MKCMQGELAAMREQRAALEAALAADRAALAGQTAEALSEASAEAFLAKVCLLGPALKRIYLLVGRIPCKRLPHVSCGATQLGLVVAAQ